MNSVVRKIVTSFIVMTLVVGIVALMTPTDTMAKGKPPKPPKCDWCAPTITIGDMTCTLEACGFDCVYTCPLPFP